MSAKPKPKQLPRGIGKTLRPPLPTKEAKPRLKVMTQCSQAHADDTSSAATTLEHYVRRFGSLITTSMKGPSEPKPKPTVAKPKRSQTVISGGISKPRSKKLIYIGVPASRSIGPEISALCTTPAAMSFRTAQISFRMNKIPTEKLLSSLGPLAAENTSSPPTVYPEEPRRRERRSQTLFPLANQPRHSRPSQLTPGHPRLSRAQKGKSAAAATDEQPVAASTAAQDTAGVRAFEGSSSFSSKNARSTTRARGLLASKKSSRQVPSSTTTRRHVNASHAKVPIALARSEPSGSGPSAEAFSRSSSLVTSGARKRREEGISSTAKIANLPQGDKRVVLPPVINPTKPAEFRFHLDARMEARKAEYEKARSLLASQKPRKPSYQVPDFKTLHALHDAELALPREREKFDEHVREKERELEREREQKRREREELEEREIRELRKKAVPRAHEVPEWYKDAPRIQREKREVESNGD
ncbi:putative targeting protein for Xklp2 (TPX2) [Lyophyllum shimeji]|uniref:Targeting protein for Xklp2 (TPX2) n=1 Tax=Lyophyllum shimeji TaxID=47721 RepID=A0A9P3PYD9_LYOSH|nr:putative targeting protein for Xklp2 (TPX2) [Lyophyllum shimeji]